jgi:hypothetical protein
LIFAGLRVISKQPNLKANMVSDLLYELCLPVLSDSALEEEEKTDKLEELLAKETSLGGKDLENTILDVLWRHRESAVPSSSPPPMRHTVIRRSSPAPWQVPGSGSPFGTPPATGVSPAPPPGFGIAPPAFTLKSSAGSPFTSPRPSPRLAFSSPRIPHSPSLNAYEFQTTDTARSPEVYGDYASDSVDWLVNDDTISVASSGGGGSNYDGTYAPYQMNMGPYDILRSVLGEGKTDEEIEAALEATGYDLSAAMMFLTSGQDAADASSMQDGGILIGKSMSPQPAAARPVTPSGQGRSGVVCRFWLSTGQCLRADCRFSHDLSSTICKYVSICQLLNVALHILTLQVLGDGQLPRW